MSDELGTTSVPTGPVRAMAPRVTSQPKSSASTTPSLRFILKIRSRFSLKFDLLSNVAGVSWAALMQLACIPLYIKFMGIESYGLIGFYLALQAMLQVLDLGLSPTISREMARYSLDPEKAAEARDLVRTLEIGYWIIGIVIGVAILIAAPLIASRWIKPVSLSIRAVRQAVMIMGLLAFLQWPLSFYQGGLMGLGRQVLFNSLKISQSTVASGGAVLVLWVISPTIQAFFLWQVIANAVLVVMLVTFLWKSMPSANRFPRFDFNLVRGIRGFAAGAGGISVFALILTQADKVILSKIFSLRVFGYYALAGIFGLGLSMIVGSVFNAIYPRFSALVAAGDEDTLKHLYHRCTQLMVVLILPLAAVLAFFSTEIMQLWTRNLEVASNAGPIASLLVIGYALNGLMTLPYALQLAYGWTGLALRTTILLSFLVVPGIWLMAKHYGPLGAAIVWPGLNLLNMLIALPLTHRRLLKREGWRWLGEIALPLMAVLLIVMVGRKFIFFSTRMPEAVVALFAQFVCAMSAAAFLSPSVRRWVIDLVRGTKNAY